MSLIVNRRAALVGAASIGAGLVLARPAYASDQQDIIDQSAVTLDHLQHDQAFGNAKQVLSGAQGVLIFPHIFKAGFFFGGEGGNGVMMQRLGHGWSQPAFFAMGSASFGLQIGAQVAETVVILRTSRAVRSVLTGHYKVGADAAVTVATLGSNAGVASSGSLADIIVWASSSGAFVGLTLNGSVIDSKPAWDRAYYGHNATLSAILHDRVSARGTAALRGAMDRVA